MDREELSVAIDQVSDAVASANDRIGTLETGIEKLQKSLTNLEKKTEEQKKKKLDTLSGLIRQLTILVGVAGGAWIIVTVLNLFKG